MTRGRWAASAIGLVLSAIVVAVWVIPVVAGPTVECVENQALCDNYEKWPLYVNPGADGWYERWLERWHWLVFPFPVTKVYWSDGGFQFTIERLWGLLREDQVF